MKSLSNLKKDAELVAKFYHLSESQKLSLEKCLSTQQNLIYVLTGNFKKGFSMYDPIYFGKKVKQGKTSVEIFKEIIQEVANYDLIKNAVEFKN